MMINSFKVMPIRRCILYYNPFRMGTKEQRAKCVRIDIHLCCGWRWGNEGGGGGRVALLHWRVMVPGVWLVWFVWFFHNGILRYSTLFVRLSTRAPHVEWLVDREHCVPFPA